MDLVGTTNKEKKNYMSLLLIAAACIIKKINYIEIRENDNANAGDIGYVPFISENISKNDRILFTISGAFRQGRIYMFNRTFLLQAARNGEYQIKNDMMHVTNKIPDYNKFFDDMFSPTKLFKFSLNIGEKLPFIAQNNAQKDGMTVVFIEITKLHVQYARDILEKGHWNIRKALEIFVHDLRYDKIPLTHFLQEEIEQIVFNCLPAMKIGMNVNKVRKVLENMKCLTEERFILQNGESNKILNKCKKDEIRIMLQKDV